MLGLALLGFADVSSPTPYLLLATLSGLLAPPVGPVMRALLARLTPQPADRQRAYSLDAVSEEALFVVGPLLAGTIALATSPAAALLVCAVLMSLGSAALARTSTGSTQHQAVTGGGDLLGPLRLTGVRWLLLAMVAVGFALAAVDVGVVARAADSGRPASAAAFLSGLSIASVLGGLLWGRTHRTAGPTVLLGLLTVMALGVGLAALLPGRALLLASLLLLGLVLAPTFVVAYVLADELVDDRVRTETNTWLGTVHNLGHAAGASFAGALAEHASSGAAMLSGAVVLGGVLAALAARRSAAMPEPAAQAVQRLERLNRSPIGQRGNTVIGQRMPGARLIRPSAVTREQSRDSARAM